MSKKKIIPSWGQVVLKPIEDAEERYGNIIIPDMGKEKPELAEVVHPGEGTYNYNTDVLIPPRYMEGDIVAIPKMGTQVISLNNGEEFYICQESQLFGKIVEE
jgi:co-chaperonin GroES (HSP10)